MKAKKINLEEMEDQFLDRNGKTLKVGDKVIWYDPEKAARDLKRVWTIWQMLGDIVYITDDDGGEAEVFADELKKIKPSPLTPEQCYVLDKIARSSKMDCWFGTDEQCRVRDHETGKTINPKKGVGDLVDGMTAEDFQNLTEDEKFTLIKCMANLLAR